MPDADWKRYKRLRGVDLPATLALAPGEYRLEQLFKNDFYAATGVYCAVNAGTRPERVLYKVYHTDNCGPILLGWLGRFLCNREVRYHELLADVAGVPRLLERHGASGLVRQFVAGCNLLELCQQGQRPDRDFFPRLESIVAAVHAKGIAHNDLSKPENVLVGNDGRPCLIDFQIAVLPADWPLGIGKLAKGWLSWLQRVDRYHVRKNYLRTRPEDLSPEQAAQAQQKGLLLKLHFHCVRQPYRAVRHFFLRNWLLKPEFKR